MPFIDYILVSCYTCDGSISLSRSHSLLDASFPLRGLEIRLRRFFL